MHKGAPARDAQQAGGNMGLETKKEAVAGAINLEGIGMQIDDDSRNLAGRQSLRKEQEENSRVCQPLRHEQRKREEEIAIKWVLSSKRCVAGGKGEGSLQEGESGEWH